MFNKLKTPGLLLALLSATLFSSHSFAEALSRVQDGQTDSPVWPRVADARPLEADKAAPNLETVRQIQPGKEKLAIYELIGHPQYGEGLFGVHEWDYVLHLKAPEDQEPTTCQLKVLFDDKMMSRQILWHSKQCEEIVNGKPPVVEAPTKVIDVAADALFAFDSAVLSPNAPEVIIRDVLRPLKEAKSVDSIKVIGTTDRLGSDAYNKKLSESRARAVMNFLISQGVPPDAIYAVGNGKASPGTVCESRNRQELIACLAPDRRVRIEVSAH